MDASATSGPTASPEAVPVANSRIINLRAIFDESQSKLQELKQLPELSILLEDDCSLNVEPEPQLQAAESERPRHDLTEKTYKTTVSGKKTRSACKKTRKLVEGDRRTVIRNSSNTTSSHPAPSSLPQDGKPLTHASAPQGQIVRNTSMLRPPSSVMMKTSQVDSDNAAARIRIANVESLSPRYNIGARNTRPWLSTVTVVRATVVKPTSFLGPAPSRPIYRPLVGLPHVPGTCITSAANTPQPITLMQTQQFHQVSAISLPNYITATQRYENSTVISQSANLRSALLDQVGQDSVTRKRKQCTEETVRCMSHPVHSGEAEVAVESVIPTKKPNLANTMQ